MQINKGKITFKNTGIQFIWFYFFNFIGKARETRMKQKSWIQNYADYVPANPPLYIRKI